MAKYRKVDPRIWNDAKFRDLSDNGKLVFFMLLTHPSMTALGAMRATVAGLAEELNWSVEGFRKAFAEVLHKGMVEHDAKACLIALPNFIKYNSPESPNVIKAWVSALDLLPECDLKTRVIARAKAFSEGMSKAFAEALPEAFSKSMPNQEPEPEQEPEPYKNTLSDSQANAPTQKRKTRIPADFVLTTDRFKAASEYWLEKNRSDLNPADEFEKFITHHKSRGETFLDWDATWKTWYCNAPKFNRPPLTAVAGSQSRTAGQARDFNQIDYSKGVSSDGSF